MLKSAHKVEVDATASGKVVSLPTSRFAREAATFATIRRDTSTGEGGGR